MARVANAEMYKPEAKFSPRFSTIEPVRILNQAKLSFNRNTQTDTFKFAGYTGAPKFTVNVVNGSVSKFPDTRPSHMKRTLLPPMKFHDSGRRCSEYLEQFSS